MRYWIFTNPKALQSSSIFTLIVDGYFRGRMARNEAGIWELLDREKMKPGHQVFYQADGEVIERDLPDLV